MKLKKWFRATVASLFVASFAFTSIAHAEEKKNIEDESIYDVLVDRYYNGSNENDFDTNPKNQRKFAGGDFKGIIKKISRIKDMGFTILSVGPIFSTEKYDGSMVTSYDSIERHFGTEEDFKKLIATLNKNGMSVMIDFPLSNVSENHEWTKDQDKQSWILDKSNGKVRWDLTNKDVQNALKEKIVQFVTTYKVGGVRLTNLDNADTDFLNDLIKAIKNVDDSIYVISNENSDADFDAKFYEDTADIFRNVYKNVDLDSSNLLKYVEPFVSNNSKPALLMLDSLWTDRFALTADKENMYVPTRMKMGIASTLLLPGVPVVQYGTEIAVSGQAGSSAHQLYNFKTDDELVTYIEDLQTLRNQSEALRKGDFTLIKNKDGILAFKRTNGEETWVVFINNSSKTVRIDVNETDIGKNKELRSFLDDDLNIVRADDNGNYPLILDREVVEVYKVYDKSGINYSFVIALALVYILFIVFVVMLFKRAKKNKAQAK